MRRLSPALMPLKTALQAPRADMGAVHISIGGAKAAARKGGKAAVAHPVGMCAAICEIGALRPLLLVANGLSDTL